MNRTVRTAGLINRPTRMLHLLSLLMLLAAAPASPTPQADQAPTLIQSIPANAAVDVPVDTLLQLVFSEPVSVPAEALLLGCGRGGSIELTLSGGPLSFTLRPNRPLLPADDCSLLIQGDLISDLDADDPPDSMATTSEIRFRTTHLPAAQLLINELDALVKSDGMEFIELTDGGGGNTPLDGLTLALYAGSTNAVYHAFDLDGYRTNNDGYLLLGTVGTPGVDVPFAYGFLRDGPAAAALYAADATMLPDGTPPTTINLIDAVVYGAPGSVSPLLLSLLLPGQAAVGEGDSQTALTLGTGRCPDGAGERRATDAYLARPPTPKRANDCPNDEAPIVLDHSPSPDATRVPLDSPISLRFSEPVTLDPNPLTINCEKSGDHSYTATVDGADALFVMDVPFAGEERCSVLLNGMAVHDSDNDDPPDQSVDLEWQFTTKPDVALFMMINELDTDTPGVDNAEFIELYDGGRGNTSLDGLIVALYNGGNDRTYRAFDLAGHKTNAAGYFVLGGREVDAATITLADAALQNGPDAVALYDGRLSDFPNGTPVSTVGLVDSIVYGAAAAPDPGLLQLLLPGEPQVDENGRDDYEGHASQRCPNGSGEQRRTAGYRQHPPTPGIANDCPADDPPVVMETTPFPGATGVASTTPLTIRFSEPVTVSGQWLSLTCSKSGTPALVTTGGGDTFIASPATPLVFGESCEARVVARRVRDVDTDDPPDQMNADFRWSFSTQPEPSADIRINEIDTDTPSTDAQEFIELYDGGRGSTSLDGLSLVLFNGGTLTSYRAIDLSGGITDANGYFVIGNAAALSVDLVIANSTLQNGPDAIALYAAPAALFPNGSPVQITHLRDAVVYGSEPAAAALLGLLAANQPQLDENSRSYGEFHSLARCPNGEGGLRHTTGYLAVGPTAGAPNGCVIDQAPMVASTLPAGDAVSVAADIAIVVTFSEPVAMAADGLTLTCESSGVRAGTMSIEGARVTFRPAAALIAGERCRVSIDGERVSDVDDIDPPDKMEDDYSWRFTVAGQPSPTPTMTVAPSVTPAPTSSPTATNTPSPTPSPTATPSATPPAGTVAAAFDAPESIWIGQTAHFTNSSSGPMPLRYDWDFGDGTPLNSDEHPTHRYTRPGSYVVTLTARAGTGQAASADKTVIVRHRQLYLPVSFVGMPTLRIPVWPSGRR